MLTHEIPCARKGCYATIALDPKTYQQLKRTGETFYCPAGHSNYYPGKTKEQKEIDSLNREVNQLGREFDIIYDQRELLIALTRRCPICAATPGRHVRIYRENWRFQDDVANVRDWMAEHLREEHGAEVARSESQADA
jgi:hypothetical protein